MIIISLRQSVSVAAVLWLEPGNESSSSRLHPPESLQSLDIHPGYPARTYFTAVSHLF